jgi:hypothetical protein
MLLLLNWHVGQETTFELVPKKTTFFWRKRSCFWPLQSHTAKFLQRFHLINFSKNEGNNNIRRKKWSQVKSFIAPSILGEMSKTISNALPTKWLFWLAYLCSSVAKTGASMFSLKENYCFFKKIPVYVHEIDPGELDYKSLSWYLWWKCNTPYPKFAYTDLSPHVNRFAYAQHHSYTLSSLHVKELNMMYYV